MRQARVILSRISCPAGTVVVIKGRGRTALPDRRANLLQGIRAALYAMTYDTDALHVASQRITVTGLSISRKRVTVCIADAP